MALVPRSFRFPLVKYSVFVPNRGWTHQSSVQDLVQLTLELKTCSKLSEAEKLPTTLILGAENSHAEPCVVILIQSHVTTEPLMSLVFSKQSYSLHQFEIVKKDHHCAFRWIPPEDQAEPSQSTSATPGVLDAINSLPKSFVKLQLKFQSILECDVFYNTIQETFKSPVPSILQPHTPSHEPLERSFASSTQPLPQLPSIASLLECSEDQLKQHVQACLQHQSFLKLVEKLETLLMGLPCSPKSQ